MGEKDKSTSVEEKNIDTASVDENLPYSQPPVIERMKAVLARAREGDSHEKTVDKFQNYDFYVPSVAKYR